MLITRAKRYSPNGIGGSVVMSDGSMALLKALEAEYGPWPAMRVETRALVYGTKVFEGAPNGALFAFGPSEA